MAQPNNYALEYGHGCITLLDDEPLIVNAEYRFFPADSTKTKRLVVEWPSGRTNARALSDSILANTNNYFLCWLDDHQTLHIVWASDKDLPVRPQYTVYHITLTRSGFWSAPQTIYTSSLFIEWYSGLTPILFEEETVLIAFQSDWQATLLSYDDDRWTTFRTPIHAKPVGLFRGPDNVLCMVVQESPWIYVENGKPQPKGSPHYRCSADGTTWPRRPSPIYYYYDPQYAYHSRTLTANDTVHVVWEVRNQIDRSTRSYWATYSPNLGTTWAEPVLIDEINGSFGIQYEEVLEAPDGRLIFVYEVMKDREGLYYEPEVHVAIREAGRWSRGRPWHEVFPDAPFAGEFFLANPAIAIDESGRLHAALTIKTYHPTREDQTGFACGDRRCYFTMHYQTIPSHALANTAQP